MSTLRVSPVSLSFCSRHSWILSPTTAQRTQRTHHPTEGNDICSRFSGLSFVVGLDTKNQRNLLPLLPSSFTTSKPVVSTKHAHSPKSFAQGSTDTLRLPFSVSSSLLAPPYLSSLCHWEIEAARTWFQRYSWPLFILKQVQCAFQRLKYVSEGRRQSIRHRRLNIRSLDTLGLNGCGHY